MFWIFPAAIGAAYIIIHYGLIEGVLSGLSIYATWRWVVSGVLVVAVVAVGLVAYRLPHGVVRR